VVVSLFILQNIDLLSFRLLIWTFDHFEGFTQLTPV
jgi:hypothetical protein